MQIYVNLPAGFIGLYKQEKFFFSKTYYHCIGFTWISYLHFSSWDNHVYDLIFSHLDEYCKIFQEVMTPWSTGFLEKKFTEKLYRDRVTH